MEAIAPLLRLQHVEILINFMTGHISRLIELGDPSQAANFLDLFGTADYKDRLLGQKDLDREDAIIELYLSQLRKRGSFPHVASAVVLNPLKDRSFFHLLYATRNVEGLRVFRSVERKAAEEQRATRSNVKARVRSDRAGGQGMLFLPTEMETDYITTLADRYHDKAQDVILRKLKKESDVSFDELEIDALQFPMTSTINLTNWLTVWKKRGDCRFIGLRGKERTPKAGLGHKISWLKRTQ
jgi:hypothetical protein